MTDAAVPAAMAFPAAPLALAARGPVANGQDRLVYDHPDFPDLLFKAPKSLHAALGLPEGAAIRLTLADLRNFRRLMLKLAPRTLWHPFFKESDCYHSARLSGTPTDDLPIPNLYGFCDSDIGPVLAVERIALPGEALGRTLKSMAAAGPLDAQTIALLDQFAARMFAQGIVAGDMTAANIALGQRGGQPQLVLIDGFGDIHAIPFRSASTRLNRIALIRSFHKMAGRIGLRFDENTLRFSRASG
ncbi:MAG: YrbL family protein [Paracoccaceae bacterium]